MVMSMSAKVASLKVLVRSSSTASSSNRRFLPLGELDGEPTESSTPVICDSAGEVLGLTVLMLDPSRFEDIFVCDEDGGGECECCFRGDYKRGSHLTPIVFNVYSGPMPRSACHK